MSNTTACVCCKDNMTADEMSTSPVWRGWCNKCMEKEIEACQRDNENDRDGWDDMDECGEYYYEDNAKTAEREYHDRKMELYHMWRREY